MNMNRTTGYKTIAFALALLVVGAVGCGSSGGASPECLDTLYHGTLKEETRQQLSQSIAKMDTEARLAAIRAISNNANSAECDEFVQELDAWEETSDGQTWHEENGEAITSNILSFKGLLQCKDVLNYDNLVDNAGDIRTTDYKVRTGTQSFTKAGEYLYEATGDLLLSESFEENDSFFQYGWDIDCTITANVDTNERTVMNIEVVDATLSQDGMTIKTYAK